MNKEKIINKLEYISNNPLINGEYDEAYNCYKKVSQIYPSAANYGIKKRVNKWTKRHFWVIHVN